MAVSWAGPLRMWGAGKQICVRDGCKYKWLSQHGASCTRKSPFHPSHLHGLAAGFDSSGSVNRHFSTLQQPSSSHWHPSQRLLLQDNMSTTTDPFPLASEKPYGDDSAPDVDAGTEAGASGDSSSNSVSISQGGMIAIIVVVVFVSLIGSKWFLPCTVSIYMC